jgi:hypothetical protein
MIKYLEILQMFVGQDDLRPAMTVPNIGNEYASATDAHALVFFDKNLLPENTVFETDFGEKLKYPDIQRFIELEDICNNRLDLQKVNDVISKCPLIEDFDEEEKEDTCNECDGSGEVTYTYEDSKYKDHELDGECPICDGYGKCTQTIEKPNGRMVKNNEYYLQCGISYLSIFMIEKLLKVQQIIGGDISIVNQTYPNKEILFKVGNVKVLIMPLMRDEVSEYCLGNIA